MYERAQKVSSQRGRVLPSFSPSRYGPAQVVFICSGSIVIGVIITTLVHLSRFRILGGRSLASNSAR